ncbi:MAG: hypothetical protein ACJ761_10220 [Chloroflexota bacterium]
MTALHIVKGHPGEERAVNDPLFDLVADLVDALQQRDASEPDAPRWEAEARIRRLELSIAREFQMAMLTRPEIDERQPMAV